MCDHQIATRGISTDDQIGACGCSLTRAKEHSRECGVRERQSCGLSEDNRFQRIEGSAFFWLQLLASESSRALDVQLQLPVNFPGDGQVKGLDSGSAKSNIAVGGAADVDSVLEQVEFHGVFLALGQANAKLEWANLKLLVHRGSCPLADGEPSATDRGPVVACLVAHPQLAVFHLQGCVD